MAHNLPVTAWIAAALNLMLRPSNVHVSLAVTFPQLFCRSQMFKMFRFQVACV